MRSLLPRARSAPLFLICTLYIVHCTSCTQYRPLPLDLPQASAQWESVSRSLCQRSKLSTEQAVNIGLLLNPELNKARLSLMKKVSAAQYAGLWEDPSVAADVERIAGGPVSARSLAPSLTLPLTGLPALAKKAEEQYTAADFLQLCADELAYRRRLEEKILEVQVAHARLEMMQGRQKVLTAESAQAEQLLKAGEMDLTDYHIIRRREGDMHQEVQAQETAHLKLHQELMELMGLHPSLTHAELTDELPSRAPAALPLPSAEELLYAPSVLAQLEGYNATETQLRAEIRKQYPELKIAPGYLREEGEHKVTLGAEISLPLWNRNRKGIAEAGGERTLKAHEVVTTWHNLLRETDNLRARQELAEQHCRAEEERIAALSGAAEQREQLFGMGETTLPAVAEARHEAYVRRLNFLENMQELLGVQIAIRYLH